MIFGLDEADIKRRSRRARGGKYTTAFPMEFNRDLMAIAKKSGFIGHDNVSHINREGVSMCRFLIEYNKF